MKKILLSVLFLGCVFFHMQMSQAAVVTVTWDGTGGSGSNSLDIDDNGGRGGDYNFNFNNVRHTSTTNFIISDGNGIAVGDSQLPADDFIGNGLTQFAGPFADLPNIDQLVLKADMPFTPITMMVNNTQLGLEEIVYFNNSKDYAIIELRALNQSTAASPIFIAIANDWDVGSTSLDDGAGFDAARQLIFQQDTTGNYSVGVASLNVPVDQFHLGRCCGLTNTIANSNFLDPYTLQRHFLNATKVKEECDDGGDAPANGAGDTCSAKCRQAVAGQVCGNGIVEGDEECDDGGLVAGDGCDQRCLDENSACGNGSLDSGEECDDNSRINGDGCDVDCHAEFASSARGFCGDGFVNNGATGNQIDPSQFPNLDVESALSVKFASVAAGQGATAAFCLIGATGADLAESTTSLQAKAEDCLAFYQQNIAVCGNGIQNAGEDCEDGNTVDNDGCDSNCTLPGCGNAVLNPGEACDDGNLAGGDGCDDACQVEVKTCGNGVLDAGEACDDGNDNNNDSCTNLCVANDASGSSCSLTSVEASRVNIPLGAGILLLILPWLAVRSRVAR